MRYVMRMSWRNITRSRVVRPVRSGRFKLELRSIWSREQESKSRLLTCRIGIWIEFRLESVVLLRRVV